jgi:hypothetical protein
MSMPLSTIVVHTSTSNRLSQKSTTTWLERCLVHSAVRRADPAVGTVRATGARLVDRLDPVVD